MARSLISINGYDIPVEPSSYIATSGDLIDSENNAEGKKIGAIIREDIASVEAVFDYVPMAIWSEILKKFNTKYGGSPYQKITYFDMTANDWQTREMTIGKRTNGGVVRKDRATGRPLGVIKAKLELTEN